MKRIAKARLVLRPGNPVETVVEIDGQELKYSAVAVRVDGSVDTFPAVELDLRAEDVTVDVEGLLQLSPKTAMLMVSLGWTPPGAGGAVST